MPRVYKPRLDGKRYKKYDETVMKQALDELTLNRNATIRSIAEKYGISRSVLQRHSTRQMRSPGGQKALTKETEDYIVQNLNTCAEWGYPLDVTDLRLLVKSYLDMLGITHKRFKNNLPGRDFVFNFLERHKSTISQRLCQNIKRARAAVTPTIINNYFVELKKSLENVPLSNIINYDETNLSDDPGRHKVITRRGHKYPERVLNHSKSSVSLMMAGTAQGELLPPYVVYKATNLYDTWVRNGPENARYNRTSSGWFDATVFKDWIKEIIIPFFDKMQGKKVLIGDNLSSHLSIELINLCKDHDIHFVFLPANSTHLTQPLDVAFFRPMKIAWRQILQKWKKTDGRSLSSVPKGCFPKMLRLLIDQIKINSENNIRAGFRKTGISPLNPNEVLARLPEEMANEEIKDAIDKSVLNLLKEMRYGSMNIVEPKTKRKLNVISGRSVSHTEVDSYVDTDTEPEIKKKRDQKVNKASAKGKGVGKKSKKIGDEKENATPSTSTAQCSSAADRHNIETNTLPLNDLNESSCQEEYDWGNIDLGTLPVVLSDELQSYEEIIIPWSKEEVKNDLKNTEEKNVIEETSITEETNRAEESNITEENNTQKDKNNKTEEPPKIIINSIIKIPDDQITKLLPTNSTKKTIRPVAINQKIKIPKKQKRTPEKNYYNDADEILKILENYYPSVSQSAAPDEGVISVDVSRDALVDSMTDMSETPIPPDIIASVDTPTENEENGKLNLAYERLYEIPKTIVDRFSDHIRYLDISHNKITNLDALVYFKSLTSLIADGNPITENCILPPLPKLELLWLNRCKIASLYPWVGKLKESCPNLQYLSLMGNPAAPSYFNGGTFYEYLQYRLFVISQFPSLNHLDDRRVTDDQRLEAQRLYKRPFFERIVKPAGLSQIVNSSVTWNSLQNKITALWGKDKANDRNLLI